MVRQLLGIPSAGVVMNLSSAAYSKAGTRMSAMKLPAMTVPALSSHALVFSVARFTNSVSRICEL